MKKWKERWQKAPQPLRTRVLTWLTLVGLAAAIALFWDEEEKSNSPHEPEAVETASTFIPAGFVLVPIEVANFESLDSILGKFGIVDLFQPSEKRGGAAIRVATNLRILRAPLNPSHFAVLAPEDDAPKLVAYEGAFIVVVQNPNRIGGTRFVNTSESSSATAVRNFKRRPSRITVEVSHVTNSF